MEKLRTFLLCLLGSALAAGSPPSGEEDVHSAVIHYALTGARAGEETVYLEGDRIAVESETRSSFGGVTVSAHELLLVDPTGMTSIDLKRNTGTTLPRKKKMTYRDYFGEAGYAKSLVKESEWLGHPCHLYRREKEEACFFRGLMLRWHEDGNELRGELAKAATSLEIDVPIAPKQFEIPKGVTVSSLQEKVKELQKASGELAQSLKTNPLTADLARQATLPDGTVDVDRLQSLAKEKLRKLVEKRARELPGGEELLAQSTGKDGAIDEHKLRALMSKRMSETTEARQQWLKKAQSYELEKRYDMALVAYSAAIDEGAESLYEARARIYRKLHRNDLALEDLDKALEREAEQHAAAKGSKAARTNRAFLLMDRAMVLLKLKKWDEAIRDLTEADISASFRRFHPEIYIARSLAWRKRGNEASAKADAEKARALGAKPERYTLEWIARDPE